MREVRDQCILSDEDGKRNSGVLEVIRDQLIHDGYDHVREEVRGQFILSDEDGKVNSGHDGHDHVREVRDQFFLS